MSRGPSVTNALIAVYKPVGITSFDVVSRVRRAVGEKRVGHAGTLDPLASGVMIVGIGQATKLLGLLTLDRKGYRARVEFGSATNTDDAEGEVIATAEVPERLGDPAFALEAVCGLVGDFDQMPPIYSAISINGKRAYALAREGKSVELSSRHVIIHNAKMCGMSGGADGEPLVWDIDLDVSKGTYVRSIARDLGESLGTRAHLCGLERTFSGCVRLEDCVSLDDLAEKGTSLVAERRLDPVECLGLPAREISVDEVVDVSCGRKIVLGCVTCADGTVRPPSSDERVSLVFDGGLVGVWQRRGAKLACETNFPQAIDGVRR